MRKLLFILLVLSLAPPVRASSCAEVLADLQLPFKLKTRGKPSAARWEQVEKTLTSLRKGLQGYSCEFKFADIFIAKKEEMLFPLIGNLLRTTPPDSLVGIEVFNTEGETLGLFENRVTFEKQGQYTYTQYYFQFRDHSGTLQSSGNRLLIDIQTGRPLFLVKWQEIKERPAISTHSSESGG